MTQVLSITGVAVLGALLSLILRRINRESGAVCAIAAGMLTLLLTIRHLLPSITAIRSWAAEAGMSAESLSSLFHILGTALAVEFAAQLCRETGEEYLAQKTLLAGQWLLLGMALPKLIDIGNDLLALLPKG